VHEPSPAAAMPDAPVLPLPERTDLGQLRRQAKDLRRAVLSGSPEALADVGSYHPLGRAATDPARRRNFTLRDAQLTLARRHGHPGWHELIQAAGTRLVEERGMHRWFGAELNNEVWDLIQSPVTADSPQDDRDAVLYGAYASARHWMEAGTVANRARGEHLIARAALAVGLAEVALRHARHCLDLVERHPEEMADWDAPFAHEALARALAATGEVAPGREHRETAVRLTAELADPEDREVLEAELAREPWFGLAPEPERQPAG
jgi:hypothetical protein